MYWVYEDARLGAHTERAHGFLILDSPRISRGTLAILGGLARCTDQSGLRGARMLKVGPIHIHIYIMYVHIHIYVNIDIYVYCIYITAGRKVEIICILGAQDKLAGSVGRKSPWNERAARTRPASGRSCPLSPENPAWLDKGIYLKSRDPDVISVKFRM